MSAIIPQQFTGYGVVDEAAGKAYDLSKVVYTPKVFNELDCVVKISHCGVCGSDLHVLSNGWPSPTKYGANGCIVGHEVIGEVVKGIFFSVFFGMAKRTDMLTVSSSILVLPYALSRNPSLILLHL